MPCFDVLATPPDEAPGQASASTGYMNLTPLTRHAADTSGLASLGVIPAYFDFVLYTLDGVDDTGALYIDNTASLIYPTELYVIMPSYYPHIAILIPDNDAEPPSPTPSHASVSSLATLGISRRTPSVSGIIRQAARRVSAPARPQSSLAHTFVSGSDTGSVLYDEGSGYGSDDVDDVDE